MEQNRVKIFIGTSANGEDRDAELAYEFSLKAHSTLPLDITWLCQTNDTTSPLYGWNTSQWATPFTAFRWAIPELCNFKGRAIFTDIDMLNLRDITELYNLDMQGKPLLARFLKDQKRHEFSVMLMDCELMTDKVIPIADMKKIPDIHQQLVRKFSNEKYTGYLDPRWNSLDGEDMPIEDIWQLHFTFMNSQPWKPSWYKGIAQPHRRPELFNLWWNYFSEAGINVMNREYEGDVKYDIIGK